MVDFKKLDIELDPIEQGFAESTYDLIFASNVLHATKSLQQTLVHVRKLLKPTGKLLLIENTRDTLDMQLVFGTLPDWWLGEEPDRKMSPNAPLATWDEVLKATGFSRIDFEISDCEDSTFHSSSIMTSTAISEPSYPSNVSIVYTNPSPPRSWLKELKEEIEVQTGDVTAIEDLEDVKVQEDSVYLYT